MGRPDRFYHGVLLFNKQPGISSHDAVLEVRKVIGQRRIGHTGTLDPRAEGLLVMCIGKATKIVRFVLGFDKTYEAEICLGLRSKTYDGEGISGNMMPMGAPDMEVSGFEELVSEYKGTIRQKVPPYSAVRVGGQRLYKLAREGVDVELPEREVEVKEITVLSYRKPHLRLRVACSSGTYIRSLADDLGSRLGCGGYLSKLTRTSVGTLKLADALSIAEVRRCHESRTLDKNLLQIDRVLKYGAIMVTNEFKKYVISGKAVKHGDVVGIEGSFSVGDNVLLKDAEGKILAVGTAGVTSDAFPGDNGTKLFNYVRVLN